MTHTTFLLPQEELDTIAPQYRFNKELQKAVDCGKPIRLYKIGSEYESGGAGGISTMEDYLKFFEVLRKWEVLKPETMELMLRDYLTSLRRSILGPTIVNAVLGEGTVPYPEIDASSQELLSNYL